MRNGKQSRKVKECGLKECGTHTRVLRAETLMRIDRDEQLLKDLRARENMEYAKSFHLSWYNATISTSWIDTVTRSDQKEGARAKRCQGLAKTS